jgi:hypothetical protein
MNKLILPLLLVALVFLGYGAWRLAEIESALRQSETPTEDAGEEVDAVVAALDARLASIEAKLDAEPESDRATELRQELKTILERVDEIASQVYDFEQENRRDLMRLQTNVLRRISQIEASGPSATPKDPVKLKAALAEQGVEINLSQKWIRIKGRFKQPERPIEALAVLEGGPTHETLFVTEARPIAIRNALVELGCETGEGPNWQTGKAPTGAPLWIYVEWDGLKRAWRMEDLIMDAREEVAMKDPKWVFVGSRFASDFRTGEEYYAADAARIALSLVHKFAHVAVIASAHSDAGNEQIWVPNPRTLPEDLDVEIRITIAPQRLEHLEWR